MIVFCDVTSYSLVNGANVSKKSAASIFRVIFLPTYQTTRRRASKAVILKITAVKISDLIQAPVPYAGTVLA
jgi:hypothetical protein